MLSYNTWFSVRQYDAMNDEYVHIVRFPQHHLAWEYINKRGLRNAKVVRESNNILMNNAYKCFWNGMEMDILDANSSYGAQQLATSEFQKVAGRKKVKGYDITVVLCEVKGTQITHSGEIPA